MMNLKIASLLLSSSLIGACTTSLPPHQDLCYDPLIWPQGTCDRRDGDGPSVVTPVKPDPDDHGGDNGGGTGDDGGDDVDTPDDTNGDHSDTSDDSNDDNSDDHNDDDSNPGKGKGKHK